MDCVVDVFALLILILHTFHACDLHYISIFIGMLLSLHQGDDTFFFIGNIFYEALDSLLSVFIEHFKFGTEIVENVAVWSLALSHYELNVVLATVIIKESNIGVIVHCCDHHIVLFQTILLQA